MQFPPDVLKTVKLYHLPTTGGASQAYPSTPDQTVSGAVLPLDRKEHLWEGGEPSDGWELYLEPQVDVRVGDKIVIEGTNYFAKKVFVARFGGLPHLRVSISTAPHA